MGCGLYWNYLVGIWYNFNNNITLNGELNDSQKTNR